VASGPDTATLEAVLDAAAWAPSAKNSQPWLWHVDGEGLHLAADWDRRLGATAFDRRDVLLACGAVLHHCAVALAATGWRPRIHRFGDHGRLASFEWISGPPAPESEGSRELSAMIPQRRSDRRDYAATGLPATTIEVLLARAARMGVQLGVVPADRWCRLDDGQVQLRYGPDASRGESSDADGVLLALATDGDDDAARLRTGEATSQALLSATALGLASCAITEPLRSPRDRVALACEVFDAEANPHMLIRIGSPLPGAPQLPAAPRRPLAETTTWAPGA
jgi:nitroreductase